MKIPNLQTDKTLSPHTTENRNVDHEHSERKEEINVFKTSTHFNVTKILVRNAAPVSIYIWFISENVTLYANPDFIPEVFESKA